MSVWPWLRPCNTLLLCALSGHFFVFTLVIKLHKLLSQLGTLLSQHLLPSTVLCSLSASDLRCLAIGCCPQHAKRCGLCQAITVWPCGLPDFSHSLNRSEHDILLPNRLNGLRMAVTPTVHLGQCWLLRVAAAVQGLARLQSVTSHSTRKPFVWRCWGMKLGPSASQPGAVPPSYGLLYICIVRVEAMTLAHRLG